MGDRGIARRRLGRTGCEVAEIGLGGAWVLGRQGDRPFDEGVSLVRHALELGIDYLDTAECYVGGRSEEVFGAALEGWSRPAVVATKFGHRPADFDFSRDRVLESIAESRRLLGGRTIDLIQIHTPNEPAWEALFSSGGAIDGMWEARERGWVRWFGITGRDVPFLLRCVRTNLFDTALMFLRYDLIDQTGEQVLVEAHDRDMGFIAASPLRMGMLGSARDAMISRASEPERRRLEALDELLGPAPSALPEAAYRFVLARPEVSVMLAGVTSTEDLDSVVSASTGSLTVEEVRAIRELSERYPGEAPL